jgi:hypothetical protein
MSRHIPIKQTGQRSTYLINRNTNQQPHQPSQHATPLPHPETLFVTTGNNPKKAVAVFNKPATSIKRYTPMTLLELLEWEFLCLKPSTIAHDRPILHTKHHQYPSDPYNLDFTGRA